MIDIHTHTKYSDGSSTVKELLEEAQIKELTLLSITDHNTIDAYRELSDPETRNLFKGKIIPGIEITTTYNKEIIEILGYGFDLNKMNQFLKENVLTFEEKQLKEYDLIKKQYKKIGVIFDASAIKFDPKKESCRESLLNEIKKYKENEKFFLYKDSPTLANFTRKEIYNPKSPLYVDESSLFPSFEKTIEMIHDSDGLAFLAHVYAYSPNISDELLNIIKNYNLDGLECFYTTFTEEQSKYLTELCHERNMYLSGGSDFHGTRKTNHNLGTGNQNLNIPEDIVKEWINHYLPNIRIITSYYEPNLDAVASSYAYSEYLNKRNKKSDYFIYGTPKKEVQIITEMFNINLKGTQVIKTNQDIIILGANNYNKFKFIKPENIIEIIDHHKKVATQEQFPNAKIHIEEVGATTTLIAQKFKNHDIIPTRETAILLYYGIISNTINLNSKATTDKDIEMCDWLESICEDIDKNKIEEIFEKKSKMSEQNLKKEIDTELIFKYNDGLMMIAQLEIANLEKFLTENRYKINKLLEILKIEKQLTYIFINCIDILNGFNIIITTDEKTSQILENSFGFKFENNTYKTNNIIQKNELIDTLKK